MRRNQPRKFDVIIIGAGVVGCSIARELSRFKIKVSVLEKENDIGWGASCRGSGVIRAGFNNQLGTLMDRYCVKGNQSFHHLADQLEIPYKKICKLVVAKKSKGKEFIENEIRNPLRIFTDSVQCEGGDYQLVSVKTNNPAPKKLMKQIAEKTRQIKI